MEGVDKKSKYSVALLFFVVLTFVYYSVFIKNDYTVIKLIDCDPSTDSCFVSDCDGGDPTCDSTTYKKIFIPSKYAGTDFDSLGCSKRNANCTIVTCQIDAVEVGERCFE